MTRLNSKQKNVRSMKGAGALLRGNGGEGRHTIAVDDCESRRTA